MNDSALEKYAAKCNGSDVTPFDESDVPDDLGSFGWLRGIRDRAIMLEIRHKNGTITAKGYSWLESAVFDPSSGIALIFSGEKITITGRNLNAEARPNVRLFAGILRHRVPWIQEADEPMAIEAPKDTTVIEAVDVP